MPGRGLFQLQPVVEGAAGDFAHRAVEVVDRVKGDGPQFGRVDAAGLVQLARMNTGWG